MRRHVEILARTVTAAVLFVAVAGWTATAGAEQPTAPNQQQTVTQAESPTAPSTDPRTTERAHPVVLGSDYVMGRYILPLIIGIAAAFALVLNVVLQSDDSPDDPSSDDSRNARERPGHL